MSASPPKPAPGPNNLPPTGGVAHRARPKPQSSIFMQKKKPVRKPAQSAAASDPRPNGVAPPSAPRPVTNGTHAAPSAPNAELDPPSDDIGIVIKKSALLRGLHYHGMRLQGGVQKNETMARLVNPYETTQFIRPVHLHRRSARDKMAMAEQSDAASGVDDKEREQMEIKRAELQAQREADRALIAPTGAESKKPAKRKPQKKFEDVYYDENDPRQKARAQLRYEEARPWHLEDSNPTLKERQIWVGSYDEPLSKSAVMFEFGEAKFIMRPIEKWYKFARTGRVDVIDSDTVEKRMEKEKRAKASRWWMGTQQANDDMRRQAATEARAQRVAQAGGQDDDDVDMFGDKGEYREDRDDLDFEFNDEFQDDDEGFVFGDPADDDAKEAEQKIRREMREANLGGTGVKDEDRDWDEEEQKEREKEREKKRKEKRLRKQLIKKERKNEYDSDSDPGEFSESSDDEDSEEERRLEEERKQQEEKNKGNGDKSGASTKGTNTPTGRAEKRDPSRSLGTSLKRPGSPDLSELSGNESTRKKAKGVNGRAVSTALSASGARSLSPDAAKTKIKTKRPKVTGAGSGSGSDTDTSRVGRPRLKLKNSPPGSPSETSPKPSRAASPSAPPSRAQSPPPFPNEDDVRAAIPPDGIDIKSLVDIFRPRIRARTTEFFAIVKRIAKQDPETKRLRLKPSDGQVQGAGKGSPGAAVNSAGSE